MANGDILSQLGVLENRDPSAILANPAQDPAGAFPGLRGVTGEGQAAPAPERGGGGFLSGLGGALGQAGNALQQASPMIIASMIAQSGGPQALGAFMAGVSSGRIKRAQLELQQRNQERQFALQERRADLEEGRLEAGRAAAQRKAQEDFRTEQRKLVEDEIEPIASRIDAILESEHPLAAYDEIEFGKKYIADIVQRHPEVADIYTPEYIENRFRFSQAQTRAWEEAKANYDDFVKQNLPYFQQLQRQGNTDAIVDAFESISFPVGPNPEDAISGREFAESTGLMGITEGGDLTVRLATPPPKVVSKTQNVAGAPGTVEDVFVIEPTAEEVAAAPGGVLSAGTRRTQQPPFSINMPDFAEIQRTPGGPTYRAPLDPVTGQPRGPGVQVKPAEEVPANKLMESALSKVMAGLEDELTPRERKFLDSPMGKALAEAFRR